MIDITKKYKQGNGLPVKIIYILTKKESGNSLYPVVGLRQLPNKIWNIYSWTINGNAVYGRVCKEADLIEVTEEENENENIILGED